MLLKEFLWIRRFFDRKTVQYSHGSHCKPSIVKRPIRFSTGQHGLIGSDFSVDENLVLFHLKFLALNSDSEYEDLSEEVKEKQRETGGKGHEMWAAGAGGLREYVSALSGSEATTAEPRDAARGNYSLNQGKMDLNKRRLHGYPFRVVQEREASVIRLPEDWLDLL